MIAYWVNEWNQTSPENQKAFIEGLFPKKLTPLELDWFLRNPFDSREMKRLLSEYLKGEIINPTARKKMVILDEFQAYSTDNLEARLFNPKHEIK